MASVAMIDRESFSPAMTNHGFGLAADRAKTVLLSVHLVVVFLGYAVHQAKVSTSDFCGPFFTCEAAAKCLPVSGPCFFGLLRGWFFWILDQIFYAAVSQVSIGEPKIPTARHLSFFHKPYGLVDWDPFRIDVDVPLLDWRSSFSWMPVSSYVSRLDPAGLRWRILPTQCKWLFGVVSEKVKKLFPGAFHAELIAECSGGRDIYSSCAA